MTLTVHAPADTNRQYPVTDTTATTDAARHRRDAAPDHRSRRAGPGPSTRPARSRG